MKKGKTLLILVLVLAALIGGTQIARQLTTKAETEAEEEASATEEVFSLTPDEVTEFSVTYEGENLSFEKKDGSWVVSGNESFPLNQTRVEAMLNTLESVESNKAITDPDELSAYGLDEPTCTVTVGDRELRIGNEQELDSYRYISTGDGNVYLTAKKILDSFSYHLDDMIRNETIPAMTDIRSFTVTTPDGTYEIDRIEDSGIAYTDNIVYFLKDGDSYTPLDTELTEAFLDNIQNLSWASCVTWNAGDEALADYGLDAAPITVTVDYVVSTQVDSGMKDSAGEVIYDTQEDEQSFTVLLSGSYARLPDSRMVYTVSSTLSDTLTYTTAAELLSDEVLDMDFSDVTGVDVVLNGETYSFEKTSTVTQTEDGTNEMTTAWQCGGGEASDFGDLSSTLQNMLTYGYATGASEDALEEVTLVLHRSSETHPETTLSFRRYDSTNCAVFLDGAPTVLVKRTDVASLIEDLQAAIDEAVENAPAEEAETTEATEDAEVADSTETAETVETTETAESTSAAETADTAAAESTEPAAETSADGAASDTADADAADAPEATETPEASAAP